MKTDLLNGPRRKNPLGQKAPMSESVSTILREGGGDKLMEAILKAREKGLDTVTFTWKGATKTFRKL